MSELADLAADLRNAGDDVLDEGRKIVQKGALNVKTEARQLISGRAHLPHYPSSITYDTAIDHGGGSITAHIGPDKDKSQGPLGTILENGSIHNAPIPHLNPALDNEEPRFERAAGELGERLLRRQ